MASISYISNITFTDARDAIAKAIYGRMFGWIVNKINQLLAPPEYTEQGDRREIGTYHIYNMFKNTIEISLSHYRSADIVHLSKISQNCSLRDFGILIE